ncbi:histidine kinase [Stanieria cyanosphaera PCC 7437]|uniref:histidine kinase n=1 Tax=Stanieria cyanosphaera (strain ATCC 29371 / PCC 7437) TaxID=111780 RepID=K9XVE8_STAC7|nr:hybrid sensor histidine kinase/response regulator [Stanieria cyanosphaera]AFZ35637.1 histidine kinase [Stanieria cyanosphaera PCC 7437]
MSKILLLLEHKENRRLLSIWLGKNYEVFSPNSDTELFQSSFSFDICILDGRALDKLNHWVLKTKKAQEPVFLPFLLMTSRQDVSILTRHLWKSIDELIISPIEKMELTARVEMLLQRRQLSLQLQLANQNLQELNKLKTRFISIASHELRNPLNLISGYAQLLMQNSSKYSEERQQDFFNRIITTVKNMTGTLNDVLLLSKGELTKQTFNPIPLDLSKFCSVLVHEIQLGAGSSHIINFLVAEENFEPKVLVDQKLLTHILINLLTNAIKYSPKGSTIELQLIYQPEKIIFEIKDQGIGIPQKDQKQLFNSFHRASNVGDIPGTGLGLAIVKQCIDLYGGTINFQSQINVGTIFTVTLPLTLV